MGKPTQITPEHLALEKLIIEDYATQAYLFMTDTRKKKDK